MFSRMESGRMCRLIQAEFAAARQLNGGPDSPALLRYRGALHVLRFEGFDHGLQIVAHQVECGLERVAIGGMQSGFRRWQRKYQPATAGIHRTKLQNIAKES